MEGKLKELAQRNIELETLMSNPATIADQKLFKSLTKEHSHIAPIIQKYKDLEKMKSELTGTRELLKEEKDKEMQQLLKSEETDLVEKINAAEEKLTELLLPKDDNSGKNIIVEIRAGTGGDEAALFARDIFRMYSRYCDSQGWKLDVISINATGKDGYKEIIFSISGEEAYDNLKYESGTHRVQRIPATEANGRIHTSAITVAVLTEAEESDVEINPDDLRIDVYRSSGHGGQSVNTTDSAVRITHIPSGLVVTCQDEKSQHKNKAKALKILRARLYEIAERERMAEESEMRRSQVGSGDRSEKIRTYNYPQSRVTDHRIGLTLHSLESILDGALDDIIVNLKKYDKEQLLKSSKS